MKAEKTWSVREKVTNFHINPDLQTNNFDNDFITTLFVNQP